MGRKDAWLITLSMMIPNDPGSVLVAFDRGKREYKSFTVMKGDGEVRSMKIRELAGT